MDVPGAITSEATAQGVDPALALSIGNAESGLNANVGQSGRGAVGPMQLMPATAAGLGVDPNDPAQNIKGGVKYIKQLSEKYGGDPALVAAAYNAGPGAVDHHGGVPPYPETQAYVAKVTAGMMPSTDELATAYNASKTGTAPNPAPVQAAALPSVPAASEAGDQTGGLVEPTPEQLAAAHAQAYPTATAPAAGEATPQSVFDQFLQHAGNALGGVQNMVENFTPGAAFLKGADFMGHQAENIASLIQTGLGNGANQQPNTTAPFRAFAGGGPVAAPQVQLAGKPQNFPERAAATAGDFSLGAAIPAEGAETTLANLLSRGTNAVVPAASALGGSEAVRAMGGNETQQNTASALFGLLGGGAAAVANGAGPAVRSAIDPFLANVSPSAAETQAGQRIANAASDLPRATSALAGYKPLVPGSPATLGDITGDLGLIGLSRQAATKGSEAYTGLVADQAAARQRSLQSISPNADPMALKEHIQSTVDNLDAQTQADIQNATANAQAKAQAMGGQGNPEDYGSTIRDNVQSALAASDARESTLWKAIDPDKSLTGNVNATKLAARNIQADQSAYDVPMNPDEQRIFGQVQSMPQIMKLADIVALRKSINDAASTEFATNGSTATYARLSALRSALGDNLANTISDVPGAGPKIEAWDNARQPPASAAATGSVGGGSDQSSSAVGTPANGGAGGTALPQAGGLGGSAGATGVSNEALSPATPLLWPPRDWNNPTRNEIAYAVKNNLELSSPRDRALDERAIYGKSNPISINPPAPVSPELIPVHKSGSLMGYLTPDGEGINIENAKNWSASGSHQISPDLEPIQLNGKTIGYTTPDGKQISATAAANYQGSQSAAPAGSAEAPTIDDAAQARMAAANAATKEQAQTFRSNPVGPTLETTGYAGQFKMPAGKVPAQFFHPGPTGATDMAALAKASPEALPAIQDYAASTLQGMTKDGIVTPEVLSRWQARYGDSIRALPDDLKAKFADAATAGDTVAQAQAARTAALKSAQSGAIGKILGANDPGAVTSYVGNILRSPTAQTDMQTLVNAAKANPNALAGLKQAVVDHITSSLTTNTEAGASGVEKISADKFQTFMKSASPALSKVLAPDEMNRLNAIAQDIQQSQRTLNATKLAGQSNTAQDSPFFNLPKGTGRSMLDVMSGIFGAHLGHGVEGFGMGMAAGLTADAVQSMRAAGIAKVSDLVSQAVFNPDLAQALLAKVKGPQDAAAASKAVIRALMVPGLKAANTNSANQDKPSTPSALRGVL